MGMARARALLQRRPRWQPRLLRPPCQCQWRGHRCGLSLPVVRPTPHPQAGGPPSQAGRHRQATATKTTLMAQRHRRLPTTTTTATTTTAQVAGPSRRPPTTPPHHRHPEAGRRCRRRRATTTPKHTPRNRPRSVAEMREGPAAAVPASGGDRGDHGCGISRIRPLRLLCVVLKFLRGWRPYRSLQTLNLSLRTASFTGDRASSSQRTCPSAAAGPGPGRTAGARSPHAMQTSAKTGARQPSASSDSARSDA